ncbi:sulfurtransferase [Pyxidicoccus caerfyrddinensis]|uniref:sulfurtransferase n=1 Tax=Pyxidicoccus caerfyrddinensis TaxID=2709663 RepID=UPI00196879AF|nr:hypothetical protein [Pyxidicoccus caerfyrddinensis]
MPDSRLPDALLSVSALRAMLGDPRLVGLYASARAWWMFRAMGHGRVAVLDGGLPAWIEAGHPMSQEPERIEREGDFVAAPTEKTFCDPARTHIPIEQKNE